MFWLFYYINLIRVSVNSSIIKLLRWILNLGMIEVMECFEIS